MWNDAQFSRFLACILATWMFVGCTTTHEQAQAPVSPDPPQNGEISTTDEQIFVGDTVEMGYDPNVIMKRAESYFDKESYAEAIVEYKHFLDLHRNHVLAPYAQYKIGISHYKQFRTVDRDPEPLNQAITAYTKLLEEFPGNRYQVEAQQTIHTCRELLAQRHLMVGEFYLKRKSYLAAAHRFEKIIKEYPDLDTAGDAMYQLAETYDNLGIEEWSQDWLIALIDQYPQNSYHDKAQKQLASLQAEHPQLVASLPNRAPKQEDKTPDLIAKASGQPDTSSLTLTHAGLLPETEDTPADGKPTQSPHTATASCGMGTWCESGSALSKPTQTSASTSTKVCKAGEWC